MSSILSFPSKNKKQNTIHNFKIIEGFLGNQYKPNNIPNWNDLLLSNKQSTCSFSDHSELKVHEYIDTILSQYPNLSLSTLESLSKQEKRLLTDMLLRMNFSMLQEYFGDYILYFLIFESYEYGRYENHLKPYCKENLDFVKKYGRDRGVMMIHASHRLALQSMSFIEKMYLLRVFITF